ncbi:insulin-like growth factor II isoform X1 [Mycetomoellerius zeteki]|uniref:insulin-like growth factor II isoform X1 n=1 Tax=Mycetomoellerius zeteki TaxID=64791 RepID=UPI00084EBAB4|nr:PREDICTED: insulin-like growth factor II isoform X1 [Trachymyrmex zeteki]
MMIRSGDRAMNEAVLLTALIFMSVLYAADADNVIFKKSHQRMQKLCSRKLSDALQVMCRDRGYNEPFYSNEDESRIDPGPGLVEECCYHQCTYEQMEQYCKPLPAEKRIDSRDDVIDLSYIANLSHSTTKDLLEQHSQTEIGYAGDAIKRKVDDLKRGRHRGKSGRNNDGECKGKADAKKRHRGRHCRCRRRRLECRRAGKVLRSNANPLGNKFVTPLTTDEPTSFETI